ncbi:MAG: SPOR domain-containing protein [Petrimonas sp.]|jgi:hypothetical protein|nr:SPOR domain-containing protein [Petrimonas sp.]
MIQKFKALFVLLALFASITITAQNVAPEPAVPIDRVLPMPPTTDGNIRVVCDQRVDEIVKMHKVYNERRNDMTMGYRVQIYFDAGNNSLERAQTEARTFQMLYPDDTAYVSYSEPYYKVRVGDFRTRLAAEGFLQQILSVYPNAFVIKDRVRLSAIKP